MRAFHDGSILAGYRLERPLGRGGMGEVWLARDARLDRPVALKVLVAALSYDPEFRLRFLEETRLAAALDHPHIVPVYEAGEADGELFLAMRYVEGADLEAIIATDGPLDAGRVVGLLRGIADALDAAHARGLIHRDVKPGNILVTRTPAGEHAYLTDFGLTKRLDAGTTLGDRIVGSVGYIAPEQIEGRAIDRRSDVYSLGCVVYAALTGQSPFVRETDAATLYAHLQAEPAPIDANHPGYAALVPVIRRALAKSPDDRQEGAGALLREVATALGVGAAAWTTTAGKADIELPYVGLRAFDETDARFYFGREDDVAALVEHLREDRFLAVFGPSGSGKSSLVRAGLLPALRTGALPGSDGWPMCVVRPGARPLEALAAQLVRLRPDAAMGRTVDDLATDPRTLHLASTLALADGPADRRVVWVVDQAEELFTLCHDDAMRAAAIATLVHAATVPDGRAIVVLAMRADFYHRCAAYPALAAAVARSQFLVTPMDLDGLRRAIIEPARLVGLEFEPGLVDTILEDVAARPGSLPLLEHALFELWDRRRGATMTLAGYRESGGVDGAIAVRAESIYNGLTDDDQAIARRILLRLTQLGEGTEDTRRRATYRELGARTADDDPVDRVVEQLVGARLLTMAAAEGTDEPVVDIAHEALLRAWPRIRTWVDEDRADLTIQRWIADAAADWERLDRDDEGLFRGARLAQAREFLARRPALLNETERSFIETSASRAQSDLTATERRRRFALAGAFVVAAFFVGLSLVAGVLWLRSEGALSATTEALAEAERQRLLAVARELVAQSAQNRDAGDLAVLLGLEAIDHGATAEGRSSVLRTFADAPALAERLRTNSFTGISLSPDGRLVAVGAHEADADTLDVWDLGAQAPIKVLKTSVREASGSVAISPDGRSVAWLGADATVGLFDLSTGTQRTVPSDETSRQIAWVDPGHLRWIDTPLTGDRVEARTWDVSGDSVASKTILPGPPPRSSSPSPEATPLATVGEVWLSPNGGYAAIQDLESTSIRVFDIELGRETVSVPDTVMAAFGSTGGSTEPMVAVSSADGTIRIFSLPDGARVGSEVRSSAPLLSMQLSPDGRTIAASQVGGGLRLWDVASGLPTEQDLTNPRDAVVATAFDATGKTLAAAHQSGMVDVFELGTAGRLSIGDVSSIHVSGVDLSARVQATFSPDADQVAVTTYTGDGFVWDLARQIATPLNQSATRTRAVAFTPTGEIVALGSEPCCTVTVGSSSRRLPDGDWSRISIGPDGNAGIVLSDESSYVWLSPTDGTLFSLGAVAAAFIPARGQLVLASKSPPLLRVVDASSGEVRSEIGVSVIPEAVAVSSDGTIAVAGRSPISGDTGTVELIDVESGIAMPVAAGKSAFVATMFEESSDGKTLLTMDQDGLVQRWDVDPDSWRKRACTVAGRNLSATEWSRYVGDEPYRETCPGLPVPTDP